MAGAFVQVAGADNLNDGAATSASITLSGVSANNLLVICIARRNSVGGAFTTPSGWTILEKDENADTADGAIFYKVADGTETNVTITWSLGARWAATCCEYSGLDATTPYESSGEFTTYTANGSATGGTAISSGSATPTTANGMAIAFHCGGDGRDATEAQLSITDSYTINDYEGPGSLAAPYAAIASKVYTSTAAQSPSWESSAGTDWQAYTAIGVFKEAGGGGGAAGIRNPMGGPIVLRNPLGRM